MGNHRGPSGWLDTWREQEPVRLYVYGVAATLVPVAVAAGWITENLGVAVTGAVAAVCMVTAGSWARGEAYAPATVETLLQHERRRAYSRGRLDGLQELVAPEPEQLAQLVQLEPDPVEDLEETRQMEAVELPTQPAARLDVCRFREDGRRCTLARHPDTFPHRMEPG